MQDRQEQFNILLEDLEPDERDLLKQAVREIATHSIRLGDIEAVPDTRAA